MLSGWNCSCASRTGSTGSLLWSSLICSLFERRTFMSGDTSISALFLFSSSKLHFVSFVTFLTESFPEVWFLHLMIISVSFGLKMFFIWINSFLLLWSQTDRRFVSSCSESLLLPPPVWFYMLQRVSSPHLLPPPPISCGTPEGNGGTVLENKRKFVPELPGNPLNPQLVGAHGGSQLSLHPLLKKSVSSESSFRTEDPDGFCFSKHETVVLHLRWSSLYSPCNHHPPPPPPPGEEGRPRRARRSDRQPLLPPSPHPSISSAAPSSRLKG